MATNNEIDVVIEHVKNKAVDDCMHKIEYFFKFNPGHQPIGDIQEILYDAEKLVKELGKLKTIFKTNEE